MFFPNAIRLGSDTPAYELGDFEAGTWTPGLSFMTPGDLSVSYTSQTERYVKIGGFMMFNCLIVTSSLNHTTASSYLTVTGFSFPMSTQFVGAGSLLMNGWSKAGTTQLNLETSNSTFMYVNGGGSRMAMSELISADVPSGTAKRLYWFGFNTTDVKPQRIN